MSELQIKWVSHAPEHEKETANIKSHKKKNKRLTKREIEELMGVHRPRYTKRGGAIRQR